MPNWLETAKVRLFGLMKVPMLASVKPVVEELSAERCVVRIQLRRWTKNHLKSMYFGALAIGADISAGALALYHIEKSKKKISLVFSSVHGDFLRRPEKDVYFICDSGQAIEEQVQNAIASGERQTGRVRVIATTSLDVHEKPVAQFEMGLSLKISRDA